MEPTVQEKFKAELEELLKKYPTIALTIEQSIRITEKKEDAVQKPSTA